jgi:hypothetical protein
MTIRVVPTGKQRHGETNMADGVKMLSNIQGKGNNLHHNK